MSEAPKKVHPQHGTLEADKFYADEHPLDRPEPGEVFVRACPSCGKLKQTTDSQGKTQCRRCRSLKAAQAAPVRLTAQEPIGAPKAVPGASSAEKPPV